MLLHLIVSLHELRFYGTVNLDKSLLINTPTVRYNNDCNAKRLNRDEIRISYMNDDLNLAARVHYSFLPESYEDDLLAVATRLTPKSVLGGDYCSFIPLGGKRYLACICDAVGHGVASALYAARINTFVLTNILQGHNPCELVSALNEFLCRRLVESGMYATFFVVFLDAGAGEMQFAGAGHPAALHLTAHDGKVSWLESETTLLGFEHPLPVECPLQSCSVGPGDRILLYTDGLTEARNSNGEEFGSQGLIRYVNANVSQHSRDFVDGLCATAHDYSSGVIKDDILCLGIHVK